MPSKQRVLVVGSTPDYIEWIRNSSPGDTLFITDPLLRRKAQEPCPAPVEEILCDLTDFNLACRRLRRHLRDEGLQLDGVACFDCESMELAAFLAGEFGLPYPSVQAVKNCRDKYISKILWQKKGLHTPQVKQVRSADEAAGFFHELGGACVLKPLSGSGSELIFNCNDAPACEQRFHDIRQGLLLRKENRLYQPFFSDKPVILAEARVDGDEYSCDFAFENGQAKVIRLTRKILSDGGPFGTALAYLLPAELPAAIHEDVFLQTLAASAEALGLSRSICMLDFMISQDRMVLLELAPRPGGDCLPFLLRRCWNLDMLKLALDFSRARPLLLNKRSGGRPCIGLRLHARTEGVLRKIDTGRLEQDRRVLEVYLKHGSGHQIKMPPEDYDSWILGHVIFRPDGHGTPPDQCRELYDKLLVEID